MPLTPTNLEDSLVDFLKEKVANKIILKSYDMKINEITYKNPVVFKGGLLPKTKEERRLGQYDTANSPYIVVRLSEISDIGTQHIVKVLIIFVVYCEGSHKEDILIEDGSGYRDIWNLIEKTRQALFTERIIAKRYRLIDKFEAKVPDEQPLPMWEGFITVNFDIGTPEKIVEGIY